jgi:hypothetical protein
MRSRINKNKDSGTLWSRISTQVPCPFSLNKLGVNAMQILTSNHQR